MEVCIANTPFIKKREYHSLSVHAVLQCPTLFLLMKTTAIVKFPGIYFTHVCKYMYIHDSYWLY